MIDVFMIFTMTIPLLEIIGHTYAEHLRLKMIELDEISEPQKLPLSSSNASVGIQPLGREGSKLDIPLVKSKLFANDKRSKLSRTIKIHLTYHFRRLLERRAELCNFFQDVLVPILAAGAWQRYIKISKKYLCGAFDQRPFICLAGWHNLWGYR